MSDIWASDECLLSQLRGFVCKCTQRPAVVGWNAAPEQPQILPTAMSRGIAKGCVDVLRAISVTFLTLRFESLYFDENQGTLTRSTWKYVLVKGLAKQRQFSNIFWFDKHVLMIFHRRMCCIRVII